jgi:hypothetical protein
MVKIECIHKWGELKTILQFVQLFAGQIPRAPSIFALISALLAAFGLFSADVGYAG